MIILRPKNGNQSTYIELLHAQYGDSFSKTLEIGAIRKSPLSPKLTVKNRKYTFNCKEVRQDIKEKLDTLFTTYEGRELDVIDISKYYTDIPCTFCSGIGCTECDNTGVEEYKSYLKQIGRASCRERV